MSTQSDLGRLAQMNKKTFGAELIILLLLLSYGPSFTLGEGGIHQMMLMSGLFIINKSTWASKNIFVEQQSNGAR